MGVLQEKRYCILGTGGFGREVLTCLIDSIATTRVKIDQIAVFMIDDSYYDNAKIMGIPVIKRSDFDPREYRVVIAIGNPEARRKVAHELPPDTEYGSIIHPSAVISDWVEMGAGSVVTAGVILTCNIKIGKHCHLNLNTTIGHDCQIGDFFTTAPGTNISGNCKFGDCVYFGSNSAVREGIKICDNSTIGMGGVVVKDILEEGVYIGNPVRKLNGQSHT